MHPPYYSKIARDQHESKEHRHQNQDGAERYGKIEDGEVLQLSSSFSELVNYELTFDGVKLTAGEVKILD
ncbi:hypothetical protein [Peribacillus kribbensis]|uniref:hypothetical protein n=1 Tax=Peribacillus kribbensis TaxID=356658 RepID=UPI00041BFF44|nr:hypothetical protein [Peribacillus kribbensis]